jgi:Protein of unknown function (DUF2752)
VTATTTSTSTSLPTGIRTRDTRAGAGAMLGLAVAWPWLPVHPPLACPFRALTGVPCPFCGMTRAVVAAMHGHLLESLRFNPAGLLVVVLAFALLAGLRVDRVRIPPWIVVAFVALLWVWNAGFNPTFH